jgi:hypothetical protein
VYERTASFAKNLNICIAPAHKKQHIGFSTFLKISTFGQCLHKMHAESQNKCVKYRNSGTHFRRSENINGLAVLSMFLLQENQAITKIGKSKDPVTQEL